jgi:N-acetylmuramoyl-L-alanine amidase
MKINVHAGHTRQNGNAPGASGIVHESIEDRRIKEEVIRLLRERGHTVYDCTSEGDSARNNLYRIVEKCNAHTVDLDVSIHLNCFNGKAQGTETLIYSSNSKAKAAAKRINNNIAALGFTNRGVKIRSDLYVLHRTYAPALLVETFFCDSKIDCNLYKKVGYKGIAKAIADGITKKTVKQKIVDKVTKKNSIGKSNEEIAKEVMLGKWGNGEERKKRLKKAGYNYKAVQKIVNKLVKGN